MKISTASVLLLGLAARVGVANASCPPSFAERDHAGDGDKAALKSAMESLHAHVLGSVTLNATGIVAAAESFAANSGQLTSGHFVLTAALSLVDDYEESDFGPMFMNDRFSGDYFSRIPLDDDDHEIDRALIIVQQAIMDEAYHASNWGRTDLSSDPVDYPHKPLMGYPECRDLLEGRKWLTATYMPGMVDPPADTSLEHTVRANVSFPEVWGRPTSLSNPADGLSKNIRPLGGLYLAPGGIASVTVPAALANQGYTVHVGSQMINANRKSTHPRMDRLTTSVPIDEATTYIGNPVGGELFIRAPYGNEEGVIDITVSGGVVESTSFFLTSLKETTEEDWNRTSGEVGAPAPWVSLETNNYLINVPRLWVYGFDYDHMHTLMSNHSAIMDAVTNIIGIPPERRNNYVMFEGVGQAGRASVGGIGFPQANSPLRAPVFASLGSDGEPGKSSMYMVRDPLGDTLKRLKPAMVTQHELGHQSRYRYSCYGPEKEAIVHVNPTYARNTVYGMDLDESFKLSLPLYYQNPVAYAPVTTIDKTATEWMMRPLFRAREEMGDDTKYNHRGHAKYVDIARLLGGWDYFKNFYHKENVMVNELKREATLDEKCPGTELDHTDCRTLRLSIEAGQDLTPLIHFWGVHPDDEWLLKRAMLDHGLLPSRTVKMQLLRYASLVPTTGSEVYDFGEAMWVPDLIGGCKSSCTRNREMSTWYNETTHDDIVDVVADIVARYWPFHTAESLCTPAPSPSPTNVPTTNAPTPAPSPSPTNVPTTNAPTRTVTLKPTTPSNNLAYNKVATQSCTAFESNSPLIVPEASLAVDGDTNNVYNDGSVAKTCYGAGPWWEVDLGGEATIDSVIVYNRMENRPNRLSYYRIQILDGAGNPVGESQGLGSMKHYASKEIDFGPDFVGNKVRVYQPLDGNGEPQDGELQLAEVEVLGTMVGPVRALRSKKTDLVTAAVTGSIKAKGGPSSSSSVVHPPKKNRNLQTADQLELSAARAKWDSAGPSKNYDFALERVNFLGVFDGAGPFLVRVRSGVVDGVTTADDGEEVDLNFVDDVPFTVDAMFATIEEGLMRGSYEKVTYDPDMGYPVDIYSEEGGDDDDDVEDFEYSVSGFALVLGAGGEACERKEECVSNKCLGDGVCAEEASA